MSSERRPGLAGLLDAVARDPALAGGLAALEGPASVRDVTAPAGLRPFAIAALAAKAGTPVLAVTATQRETDDLVAAVASLLPRGADAVSELPAWETLPHERLSPRADTVGRR